MLFPFVIVKNLCVYVLRPLFIMQFLHWVINCFGSLQSGKVIQKCYALLLLLLLHENTSKDGILTGMSKTCRQMANPLSMASCAVLRQGNGCEQPPTYCLTN